MSLRDDLLVWIDLEMTGLDPHENKIIEIATIITDSELSIIAEGPNIVINQPEEELDKMDEWNVSHHTENGKLMFIYQAHQSFTIWHNLMPEINEEVINLF